MQIKGSEASQYMQITGMRPLSTNHRKEVSQYMQIKEASQYKYNYANHRKEASQYKL